MPDNCQTWPGWECVREIGKGSYGRVYEIQRNEFGKTYTAALKVITIPQDPSDIRNARSEGMDHKEVTEYFRSVVEDIANEFSLMSKLKGHSNIVSYEDHMIVEHANSVGWDILIRMELLTSLQTWCQSHTLTEKDIIQVGTDICRALEICGKHNIIHRDIKMGNIFVNDNGDYKLGDFGIARTMDKTTSEMSQKGTYTYMAPEVYLGKPYGSNADIYSLAMVLYRFLNNNRVPFLPQGTLRYEDRKRALELRMGGGEIPEPVHGSKMLKKVILKALSYVPENRYASAAEFSEALTRCLAGPQTGRNSGRPATARLSERGPSGRDAERDNDDRTTVLRPEEKASKKPVQKYAEGKSGNGGKRKGRPAVFLLAGCVVLLLGLLFIWKNSRLGHYEKSETATAKSTQDTETAEALNAKQTAEQEAIASDHATEQEPREESEPTATSAPEPTATPTPEPTATSTPSPEPTATPTLSPEPTATLTPVPAVVPAETADSGDTEIYKVNVVGGKGTGYYKTGALVTVTADDREKDGYQFEKWIVDEGLQITGSDTSSTLKFYMGDKNVLLVAQYKTVSGDTEELLKTLNNREILSKDMKGRGYIYRLVTDGTVSIVQYTGAEWRSLEIPETINGDHVSAISHSEDASPFTKAYSLTLPEGILEIGERSFLFCSNLYEIFIPDSVIRIGANAFQDCSSLVRVFMGNGVKVIEDNAFSNCTSLWDIALPYGLEMIGSNVFSGCSDLSAVTIPDSVVSIGKDAIPEGVTIRGSANSYAETYAKENGFEWAVLSSYYNPGQRD